MKYLVGGLSAETPESLYSLDLNKYANNKALISSSGDLVNFSYKANSNRLSIVDSFKVSGNSVVSASQTVNSKKIEGAVFAFD
jgi:hypothetical protein